MQQPPSPVLPLKREEEKKDLPSLKDVAPVWTPGGGGGGGGGTPGTSKKEYKPVKLDTSVKPKPQPQPQSQPPKVRSGFYFKGHPLFSH